MKPYLTHILTAILSAAASFYYFHIASQIELAKVVGKVEVMAKFCEEKLEKAEIVKKVK